MHDRSTAVPRRARIQGSSTFVSLNSRLESSTEEEKHPAKAEESSLEQPPDLDPFFDDLKRAKSAKELKEHLETRVLGALLLTQVLRKGAQIWGLR